MTNGSIHEIDINKTSEPRTNNSNYYYDEHIDTNRNIAEYVDRRENENKTHDEVG